MLVNARIHSGNMVLRRTDMVKAAANIIRESGIDGLSVKNMAFEMKIEYDLLLTYLKNDEGILTLLLASLENEFKQLTRDMISTNRSPEDELRLLFERIYKLFNDKPHYLPIIFSTELKERDAANQVVLTRIKTDLRGCLTKIIKNGKSETLFKNKLTARYLTRNILGSFRSLMNEQRIVAKMVKDMEALKNGED